MQISYHLLFIQDNFIQTQRIILDRSHCRPFISFDGKITHGFSRISYRLEVNHFTYWVEGGLIATSYYQSFHLLGGGGVNSYKLLPIIKVS